MPQGIVDRFQAINIDHDDDIGVAIATGLGTNNVSVFENPALVEARQISALGLQLGF